MSDETLRINEEELDDISGGKKHGPTHDTIPAGAIEKKENLQHESKEHRTCIKCGSNELEKVQFYFVETKKLHKGQRCKKCGAEWIYGNSI